MTAQQNPILRMTASFWRDRPLLSVLAVSLAVRMAYAALLLADPVLSSVRGLDSQIYLARAAGILAGDWLGTGPLFYSGMVYPYLLALLGASFPAIVIVQMLMDTAVTGLVFSLGRSLAGTAGGVAAGLLHALSAVFVFAAATVLFDPWTTFFVLLAVLCAVRAAGSGKSTTWLCSGLALGLAATARPFVLAFAPLVVAGWFLPVLRPLRRDVLRAAVGLGLGIAIALAPLVVRNSVATSNPLPFPEGGGLAFYLGNNPHADGTYVVPSHLGIQNTVDGYAASARDYPSRRQGRSVTAGEASAFWFREGLRFWMDMPGRALALTGRKFALLVNRTEVADNYDLAMFRERIPLLRWLPDSTVIIPLGLLGAALSLRRWRDAGPVLLMTAVLGLFIPLFWMAARFRYPFVALLAVTGGAAVPWLAGAVRERKGRRIAAALGGLAACVLLTVWPVDLRSNDATLRQQLALAHLSAGDEHTALAVVEQALARDETAQLHYLRAQILFRMGQQAEARRSLEKSVDINPRFEEAHVLLEQAAAAPGDLREGELRRAAEQGGGGQQALLRLGRYYLERKRYLAAIRTLEAPPARRSNEAVFMLGTAYLLRGMPQQAATLFEQLDREQPGNPNVLVNLGFAYLDGARYGDAERVFRLTLDRGGPVPLARYGLGLTFKLSGRAEPAAEQFRMYLEEVPGDSYWGRRARKNLEEMR